MEATTHRRILPSKTSLAVMGAAGALGAYLYKHPTLRKKMWKSHSPVKAVKLLGNEIRNESADVADMMIGGMAHSMAEGLKRVRRTLGVRYESPTQKKLKTA